jgi:hypothetical protein
MLAVVAVRLMLELEDRAELAVAVTVELVGRLEPTPQQTREAVVAVVVILELARQVEQEAPVSSF